MVASNLMTFFSAMIGIIAIVLGIDISRKVVGQLRILLIAFILTASLFTIGEITKLIIFLANLNLNYPEEIVQIILALFFLTTMIIMKRVIEGLGKVRERSSKRR